MKIKRPGANEAGFALESTLMVLLLISTLLAVAFAGVLMTHRTADADYRGTRVSYAAEGGAEAVMAQLADALEDGILSDSDLAAVKAPTLPGFTYSTLNLTKVGGIVNETITDGAYAGLYSLTQKIDIRTEAQDAAGSRSEVIVSVKAQSIPIFQFGVFFEKDLEATNGPPMEFAGWVHSNGNIHLSSANAWYRDVITTPNKIFHDRKDNHDVKNGVFVNDASAAEVQLDFDSRTHPSPPAFRSQSDAKFDNRVKTDAYDVDSLKVPLPQGMDPIEVMRPRVASDPEQARRAKMSWKADWYVEVDLTGLATKKATCPKMNSVRAAGKVLPSNSDCKDIFSFDFEKFFEARERRYADVLSIDVDKLSNWGKNDLTANNTQLFYVTFVGTPPKTPDTDASGDGFFPVVRLFKGKEIKSGVGLTVATDRPLYVEGDYNSDSKWVPAALIGDAVTILSNAWDDGKAVCNEYKPGAGTLDQVCKNWKKEAASDTWVYAAILAGHSGTPCDHENAGCPGGYTDFYGGGIENFPRFLETWSGKKLTYRGSLVSLSFSAFAVGTWNGRHYNPPQRDWQFDTRFKDPANLPPGTPVVGQVIRTAFRPVAY